MRKRSIIIGGIAGIVVLSGALVLLEIHARDEAELTKTISYTHNIVVHLRGYQKQTGHWPATLEAMVSEGYMDSGFLRLFLQGTKVDYQRPPDTADDNFPVLQVHYREKSIVITRSFDRTIVR
jgi:hypothetical protein